MTNLERLMALLERERYARQWTDRHVAGVILAEFGIDPGAETVTEAEVHEAQAEAERALKRAQEVRDAHAAAEGPLSGLRAAGINAEFVATPVREAMPTPDIIPARMTSSDLDHG